MPDAQRTFLSPVGPLTLSASDDALTAVSFDGAPVAPTPHPILDLAELELRQYFRGALRRFAVPLEPSGTPFQQSVWAALLAVPFGEVQSYASIAKAIGSPSAVRAVGAANGRNPIAILVPCHRIVGAKGNLVGYGGGLERKQWLLGHERRVLGRTLDLFAARAS